ncbi:MULTISPECIES: hypothetical protein [Acetobacter]|uniref:Transposase n=1 Tax=Acetobacter thailandicus TaxID=1502842 RepID=A0ABT3QGX7_9PROT|nr:MULTISPECIES: hypothetical protein [Acetobacter]MBS0960812.1 hypothetical protein [Acetobacter thailandicus]MBS0985888.1 hypothetical protein [Acetobacter thailandicus]MCX2564537.1 hypothetical protein [Acetobacter thailandicus]
MDEQPGENECPEMGLLLNVTIKTRRSRPARVLVVADRLVSQCLAGMF